jgi:hypothetical protein
VIAVAVALALAGGIFIGRALPRRGRHAKPITRHGRERFAARTQAKADHPAASGNVVIDLRAWVPTDESLEQRLTQTPAWPSVKIVRPVTK